MIRIELDMRSTLALFSHIEKELRQAIRSGVNATTVLAKRAFVDAATPEIGGRVSRAGVRKQITPVKRASAAILTASFTISNKGFKRTPTLIDLVRGNQHRPGKAKVDTFLVTGGGSHPLNLEKGFQISAHGGRVIMVRHGKKLKRIFAAGPATLMGMERNAPRKQFNLLTPRTLSTEIGSRVQAVLDGQSGSANEATE